VFEIAIQTGAMLAVIWEYRSGWPTPSPASRTTPWRSASRCNVLIAFIPAVVLGLLFGKSSRQHLFHPVPVAIALHRRRLHHPVGRGRHRRLYGEMRHAGHAPGARGERGRHDAGWTR
jgi:undecaprenyl-diphosphatase